MSANQSLFTSPLDNATANVAAATPIPKGMSEWPLVSAIYIIFIIFGFVLNVLTIIIFSCGKRSSSSEIKSYLITLAVADLITSLVTIPFFAFCKFILETCALNNIGAFCALMPFIVKLAVLTNLITNATLSIERYVAIANPLKIRASGKKHIIWLNLTIWTLAVAIAAVNFKVYTVSDAGQCSIDWDLYSIYTLVTNSIFALSVCLVLIFYALITIHLSRHNITRMHADSQTFNRRSLQKRSIKMLWTINILLFISWLPYAMTHMLTEIHYGFRVYVSYVVWIDSLDPLTRRKIDIAFDILNSSTILQTPIIYMIFLRGFTFDLKDLFQCVKFSWTLDQSTSRTASTSNGGEETRIS